MKKKAMLTPLVQKESDADPFGSSVLADLGLPQSVLLLALVGFNLGVEIGQLAIVSAFLPLAYAMRGTTFYRRAIFTAGSGLIVLIAAVWLVERAFDLTIFSAPV